MRTASISTTKWLIGPEGDSSPPGWPVISAWDQRFTSAQLMQLIKAVESLVHGQNDQFPIAAAVRVFQESCW